MKMWKLKSFKFEIKALHSLNCRCQRLNFTLSKLSKYVRKLSSFLKINDCKGQSIDKIDCALYGRRHRLIKF